jgi:hypothetical protein
LLLEPRPPIFKQLTRAFHSAIIVADNFKVCQDTLFESRKTHLLHSYIQLQDWRLIYSKGLEVDHGNVVPTEQPPIVIVNKISLSVTKDYKLVGVCP